MGRKKSQHTRLLGEENLGALMNEPEVVTDLETSGLSPWRDKIAVFSFYGLKSKTGVVIHNRGRVSKEIKKFIESRKLLIGHNLAGFDLLMMHTAGINVFDFQVYDSMIAELCLLSTDRRDVSVNLKSTLARRTGKKIEKNADHGSWMNARLNELQLNYCFEDIEELGNLRSEQLKKADPDQLNAMDVEHGVVPGVVKMVTNGMPMDLSKLRLFLYGDKAKKIKGQEDISKERIQKLNKKLGGQINYNSPAQLKKALANIGYDLKSTAAEVLEEQTQFGGELGEICKDLLWVRHANQRLKMYSETWINQHVVDGYVHPRIWTCNTDTGRMSSSDPNIQQIPADMRGVFGGVPGHKMVWADYSQLEVRVAAAVSNCPGLMRVFSEGLHVHTDIASKAFRTPYKKVDEGLIRLAKGLTFTLLFGGGWPKFQQGARLAGYDLSDRECEDIFRNFFREFPGMKALKDMAYRMVQNYRVDRKPVILRLPTGLKRVLVDWKVSPSRIMNTLIQGGAAAGLKFALLEAHDRGLTDYMCAAVHDEFVACVPNKMVKSYMKELEECMAIGMKQIMDVPAPAVAKSGDYWGK
jgi:DNA polymerase I-like protein with 3'-5' exonuclease and polymerase domains